MISIYECDRSGEFWVYQDDVMLWAPQFMIDYASVTGSRAARTNVYRFNLG